MIKTELIKEDDEFLYLNLFDEDSELKVFSGFGFQLEQNPELESGEREEGFTQNDWSGEYTSEDVIDVLNEYYESEDVIKDFRRQDRLISNLQSFTEEELKENFYEPLKIPEDKTKQEFIELVKEKTQSYFNK